MKTGIPKDQNAEFTAETLKKIGARIRALRIAHGHPNFEKFAYEHDISRSQLWRYESGEDFRFSSFLKILQALNVGLSEFFSEGF